MNSQQVVQAIYSLYGKGHPGASQSEANAFLCQFSESEDAWSVSMQILMNGPFDEEVAYFVANIVYAKVQRRWSGLDKSMQDAVQNGLMECLNENRIQVYGKLAVQRICLALAGIAFHVNATETYLTMALERAGRGISVGIEMLSALIDEMENTTISYSLKSDIKLKLIGQSSVVFDAGQRILTGQLKCESSVPEVLQCLQHWINMTGYCVPKMYTEFPMMLEWLLQQLGGSFFKEVAEILSALLSAKSYPMHEKFEQSMDMVLKHILQTKTIYEQYCVHLDFCRAYAKVVAQFAECRLEWIAKGNEMAMHFIELVITISKNPQRQVATMMLDFWLDLQELPVDNRSAILGKPIYMELLKVLVDQCAYPNDFRVSWDEYDGEADEDDFIAFRVGSSGIQDVLEATYSILQNDYMKHVMSFLNHASWQHMEACVFVLSSIVSQVVQDAQNNAEIADSVRMLLSEMTTNAKFTAHALLVARSNQFIGKCCSFISKETSMTSNNVLLLQCISYLSSSLHLQAATKHASIAIRQICCSCGIYFTPTLLKGIISSMEQSIQLGYIESEGRLEVSEGITRAAVQLKVPEGKQVLVAFTNPIFQRLQQYLTNANASTCSISSLVCCEIDTLGTVVRFLDAYHSIPNGDSIPLSLLETVWPLVESCIQCFSHDSEIMDSLFSFFESALKSLGQQMQSVLPILANHIIVAYRQAQYASALNCAATAVDIFGNNSSDATITHFREIYSALSTCTFEKMQSISMVDGTDLILSFFDMTYRYLLFSPSAIFTTPEYGTIFDFAVACLLNQHRESTRSVINVLVYIIENIEFKLAPFQSTLRPQVLNHLKSFITNSIHGLAIASPTTIHQHLSQLLLSVLSNYGNLELCQQYLSDAFQNYSKTFSSHEQQQLVLKFLSTAYDGTKSQFRMLTSDFSKVCRNEANKDSLEL